MGRARQKYTETYKAEAVELVASSGRPIAEIARDLGSNEGTLGNWVALEPSADGAADALVPLVRQRGHPGLSQRVDQPVIADGWTSNLKLLGRRCCSWSIDSSTRKLRHVQTADTPAPAGPSAGWKWLIAAFIAWGRAQQPNVLATA
jgi:hypothetical protein